MTTMQQPDSSSEPVLDRTHLAALRNALALDRTTLAWIRTTLTMATFGFGMIGFFRVIEEKAHSEKSAMLHQAAIKFGTAWLSLGFWQRYCRVCRTGKRYADYAIEKQQFSDSGPLALPLRCFLRFSA
jgi:putative membrane protein